ncbi:VOC family protein [Halobacillus salinarum]|uniref:VOC family protein n=1 Tax=Halobacillus salinarum TaxID=2932257 RepID=A0ABY4EI45_9BACI|nr:VOC family protein [Halobacillus salinarum]UOQ44140.1 VOC family protein [Halobacillus salinarum]
MIQLTSIHHVSLAVTHLEKAKEFYGEKLGFTELKRPDFDFPGAWYQIGSQQLHLIVFEKAETLRSTTELESKDGHVAFRVESYEATKQHLLQAGIEILEKPTSKSGFAQIFCADPDGNLIEFNVPQAALL